MGKFFSREFSSGEFTMGEFDEGEFSAENSLDTQGDCFWTFKLLILDNFFDLIDIIDVLYLIMI